MKLTFGEFKIKNVGGFILIAAEDIVGFCKRGMSIYGNCDDMTVVNFSYDASTEIYTVYLVNSDK